MVPTFPVSSWLSPLSEASVNLVWIAPSVSSPQQHYPCGPSRRCLARACSDPSGAWLSDNLFVDLPAVATKSESEKRKTNLFSESARCARANPFSPSDATLSGEDVAPFPQQLRWIDAVFAPEEPGELGRTAEAVRSGNLIKKLLSLQSISLETLVGRQGRTYHDAHGERENVGRRPVRR
jgi:hypothetical protein